MMKVTVAIDSFKGSISSASAGVAAKVGVLQTYPDADVYICPMADGGEGTMETLTTANGGELVTVEVSDPLGRRISAKYGYISQTKTAVIEMAAASGITLVAENERDPLETTTYGTGEIIKDAILRGCRKFVVGIGGSATNDGGVGMLEALGFEFLDSDNTPISRGAKGLKYLAKINTDKAIKELKECSFVVACDVKNPLCGHNGCSAVFGPQKGATVSMISDMDKWLESYAKLTAEIISDADPNHPGAGAAGGMGFALMSYMGAELVSGVDLVMREVSLEDYIKRSDVVITGEGRLDGQSCMGKVPVGVARLAKKHGKICIAFSGAVAEDAEMLNSFGIDAFFPVLRRVCSLDEAMNIENAAQNLTKNVAQVFRLIKNMKGD